MRRLIAIVLFLALAVAGLWLGGETLIAGQLRSLSQAGLGFQAASVTPLRQTGRIGADLRQVGLQTAIGTVQLPQAQVFMRPSSPTTLHLALPSQASLDLGSGPQPLQLTDPQASARLRPGSGLVPGLAQVSSGPMVLDGQPLAQSLSIDAAMMPLGHDAPQDSVTAYDIDLSLQGLEPAGLPQLSQALQALGVDGKGALTGQARLWLDRAATPAALAGAQTLPTGLRIDQAQLTLGRLSARIAGFVRPDADGRALGAVAIYTRDATPMLDAAAKAGLIPNGVVKLAGSMLRRLSDTALPGEQDAGDTTRPQPIAWAKPQDGELRLPLVFANGRMALGPIPLGAAPLMRP